MSETKALILAAGIGSRLMPYTQHLPKCIMPVKGRPLLGYWLLKLEAAGVNDVLINTHYLAEMVRDYLNYRRTACNLKTVHEESLLGTAGTIRDNYGFLAGARILLIHGDNWSKCDLQALLNYHLHKKPPHCLITMMTFTADNPSACGVVEKDSDGTLLSFHEKVENPPVHEANAAIYVLEPEVVDFISANPTLNDFSMDVIPLFLGRISCWYSGAVHRDLGTIKNLLLAQNDPLESADIPIESEKWMEKYRKNPAVLQIASMAALCGYWGDARA